MKIVVFGLAVSSSWGNGHATLWRALGRALASRGVELVFFERDQPYYAETRDATSLPGMRLVIYPAWCDVAAQAAGEVASADVAMVTSFCPDAQVASDLVCERARRSVFYDLDTPVTLATLTTEQPAPYIPRERLGGFDLVLSYTGGGALDALRVALGARQVAPLYGCVDPEMHVPAARAFRDSALTYLGTYSDDRQAALESLLVRAAVARPSRVFLVGGAQYPHTFPWRSNIHFVRHVPPRDHAAFYARAALTLNVTRAPMAAFGYCPAARFFEAAACGTTVVSDVWQGIELFFEPGRELLLARSTDDVLAAIDTPSAELIAIGRRARERVLDEHTAWRRSGELLKLLELGDDGVRAAASGGV